MARSFSSGDTKNLINEHRRLLKILEIICCLEFLLAVVLLVLEIIQ